MQQNYTLLTINPGSTSTKLAVFQNDQLMKQEILRHAPEELKAFHHVIEQYHLRYTALSRFLEQLPDDLKKFSAIVGRGGPVKPLAGGTYHVNDDLVADLKAGGQTEHASLLGGLLAKGLADQLGIPAFIVDPVSVDELEPIARVTGLPEIERHSWFHALNMRSVARQASQQLGRPLSELNLLLAHLGGGISVGMMAKGKIIDVSNPNESGPFAPERAGALPTGSLVSLCFSGQYTKEQIMKKLIGQGGLLAHLGTTDALTVERRIADGDQHAAIVYQALAYQVAKEIGAMATVVHGQVDAIVLTGGMAYSAMLVGWIQQSVQYIAPVLLYPGEDEMRALALGALRVLRKQEEAKNY